MVYRHGQEDVTAHHIMHKAGTVTGIALKPEHVIWKTAQVNVT
jgi:hypothetical protein